MTNSLLDPDQVQYIGVSPITLVHTCVMKIEHVQVKSLYGGQFFMPLLLRVTFQEYHQ